MGNISADANRATSSVSMAINFVENFLKLGASAMSNGKAVCEEFCDEVSTSDRILELPNYTLQEIEEIKCSLHIDHFTGLVERMVQEGYCCTQVQRNANSGTCTAWFEPTTLD